MQHKTDRRRYRSAQMSEDCIFYLNVWAPRASAHEKLPVIFGPLDVWTRTRAERVAARFAAQLGVRSIRQLRSISAERLLAATGCVHDRQLTFWPYVDGQFLRETPQATFAAGGQARVPLLLGSHSQERHFTHVLLGEDPTPPNWQRVLERIFRDQAVEAAVHYPGADRDEVIRSATTLAGDLTVGHAAWRWMNLHRQTSGGERVYFYDFSGARPLPARSTDGRAPNIDAFAPASVDYALDNLHHSPAVQWSADDSHTAQGFSMYVAEFVRRGDPNGLTELPLMFFSAIQYRALPALPKWSVASDKSGALARQKIGVPMRETWDMTAGRHAFIERFFEQRARAGGCREVCAL